MNRHLENGIAEAYNVAVLSQLSDDEAAQVLLELARFSMMQVEKYMVEKLGGKVV